MKGLPFHDSGRTWLAIIHGKKRWFLYPPGYSPLIPTPPYSTFNPLRRVVDWMEEIYPRMTDFSKPSSTHLSYDSMEAEVDGVNSGLHSLNLENTPSDTKYYKPFECIQYEGEIMYVPAGWQHMTMNIGETIAVGGQEPWLAGER